MNNSQQRKILGIDIGGTKCAVSRLRDGRVEEVLRITTGDFEPTFRALVDGARAALNGEEADIGVSCGGPLDGKSGVIISPPNLHASWYGKPVCALLTEALGGRVCLMNDANACALAEWRFGAGQGTQHMVFLTAGTGLGAGLILNGVLYEGATGDAGEIGHVRLAKDGPVGFGKAGSAEGFCSGGGIARLAERHLAKAGKSAAMWLGADGAITAKQIAEAARAGDAMARAVMNEAGEKFGEMLAMLIDVVNPECIVLGGIFPRCRDLLEPAMNVVLEREALPVPRKACRILPAELGETIGSHGAIAAALSVFRGF